MEDTVDAHLLRLAESHSRMQAKMAKALEPYSSMQSQIAKALEPHNSILTQMAKNLEPYSSMQSQIAKALEPHNSILTQMAKALEPYSSMQSQIAKALEPHNSILTKMSKTLEPYSSMQSQIAKALEPHNSILTKMAKTLEPYSSMQSQITKALEPHNSILSQMAKALEPYSSMQVQMVRALEPQKNLYDEMLRLREKSIGKLAGELLQLADVISTSELDGVQLVNGNVLRIGNESAPIEELTEQFAQFSSKFTVTSGHALLSVMVDWLSQLKGVVRNLALFVFLPYIIAIVANLTTPIYEEWSLQFSEMPPREAKKSILKEANENYSATVLRQYHFVDAKILHVRLEGNSKSEIVDELYRGKVVLVLEKRKRWSLIEYSDSFTGKHIQGWVFSRYLSKFIE